MFSPFPTKGPVEGHQLRGRDELASDLVERVSAHRPTVLYAPRRFGKTSLMNRLAADLADTTTVVRVDLYEVNDWSDAARRFAVGLDEPALRGVFADAAASIELNLGALKVSLGRDRSDGPAAVAGLVGVLVGHARRAPTALLLDEFSSAAHVKGLTGELRTQFQHHYGTLGLVFAGSQPSTMRMLFSDPTEPFFDQADLLEVPPLSLAAVTDIVDHGFDGAPPPGLAAHIHRATGGHPHRAMQLADAAWTHARTGDGAPEDTWVAAWSRVTGEESIRFESQFASFGTGEKKLLRVVAGGHAPYGNVAKDRIGLSASAVEPASRSLVDAGVVTGDPLRFVDPLFANWVRERLP